MTRAAAFWSMLLSGGLALALGGAALGVTEHAATLLLAGPALVVPAVAIVVLVALAFRRAPEATFPPAAPPVAWCGDDYGTADEPILPVIAFAAYPVVSVADGREVAAVAIEPSFRLPDYAFCTPEAVAWERVPAALAARLDATLLERAADRARAAAEHGRRGEAVIVSVAASSLRDTVFLTRLAAALDGAGQEGRQPARLVVLARGDAAEAAGLIAALPGSWRGQLGLHLTSPPRDEAEVEGCLAAEPATRGRRTAARPAARSARA
jgi:hypothetical protein